MEWSIWKQPSPSARDRATTSSACSLCRTTRTKETSSSGSELCPEKLPEEYQPQHPAQGGNDSPRSPRAQHLAIMLKNGRSNIKARIAGRTTGATNRRPI